MKTFFWGFTCWALCMVAIADETAINQLSAQLEGTDTISADFKQTITDLKGSVLQQATGKLIVKRPNKLHWLTQEPYEHLVVTDGSTLWLYDIDLEQVNKESYNGNIDRAPALILSGNIGEISQHYDVSQSEITAEQQAFDLLPKSRGGAFSHLTIIFKDRQIVAMKLLDNFDQITQIDFSNMTVNADVPEQQFQFIPPAGVEVISNDS